MPFEEARAFVDAYAREIGQDPPSEAEFEQLLELAGVAAHASVRQAAPVACWVAALSGLPPDRALEAARRVAAAQPGGE